MDFTSDPYADWIEAHRDEIAQHVGRFVMFDLDHGIVGIGDDPVELGLAHRPWDRMMILYVSENTYRIQQG